MKNEMMADITLNDSFEKILGKNGSEYTASERKERWERWKKIARDSDKQDLVNYWSDTEGCEGCIHINESGAWCNLMGLPCAVNPVLSFRHGMIGMACMGAGKETAEQVEISFKEEQ